MQDPWGYYCVRLDRQSHIELKKMGAFPRKHAHHVELDFYVRRSKYERYIGKPVRLSGRMYYKGGHIDALTIRIDTQDVVELLKRDIAYVTLSRDSMAKPRDAWKMILDAGEGEPKGPLPLSGHVAFVPFQPQPERRNQ